VGRFAAIVFGSGIFAFCCLISTPALANQRGLASWYSERDPGVGRKTASGERFDDSQRTCASWKYKFGTFVKVTNRKTGQSVICRVNDRGPSRHLKRIIDLSKASFHAIAPLKEGLVPVRVSIWKISN
jgi:rare lipoprotein A